MKVTLHGYTYQSTIASMGNGPCLPLRRSHRQAAGLEGNETLRVTLELDAERKVQPPPELLKALRAVPAAWQRWTELSYSHQREHVDHIEEAKQPQTRTRRIERTVLALRGQPAAKKARDARAPARRQAGARRRRLRGGGLPVLLVTSRRILCARRPDPVRGDAQRRRARQQRRAS